MDLGQRMLESLNRPLVDAMDKAGLTLEKLIGRLKKELNAKETKFFSKDGMVIEERNVVAWDIRQKARIDAHKLRGDYAPVKVDHNGTVTLETVHRELEDRIKDME